MRKPRDLETYQDDDDDDDDGDDVVVYILYSAVTTCYCSMLGALGRVESCEDCCQWSPIYIYMYLVCKSLD